MARIYIQHGLRSKYKKYSCLNCGKSMKSGRSKLCRNCYYESLKGKGNPMFGKRYAKIYYCIDCNKKVSGKQYKRCHSCAMKYLLKTNLKLIKYKNNRYGQNNPNWQNGKSFEPYSSEFNEILKEKIRQRDNYTCQNCEFTNEEHLIIYNESLSIHHIDYNKKNCNENNLITLCKQCNVRANYNRNCWINLYKEKMYELQGKS